MVVAFSMIFLLSIISTASIVSAAVNVQTWCYSYPDGFSLCGERRTIVNEVVDAYGGVHYNYKDITKLKLYSSTGLMCNSYLYTTKHNYLLNNEYQWVTRIYSYYHTPGVNFNTCEMSFYKMLEKYDRNGLQFCNGILC